MYGLPTRSDAANQSVGLFYRALQEIEIYVEDVEAEAIYTELLSRATNYQVKIKKVISLGGRGKVVERCLEYDESFPALFIIDGDLDLLLGEREGPHKRLYQHRLYCLENYLFCSSASVELLRDYSGRLLVDQAKEKLEWDDFIAYLSPILLELFKVYAVSWKALEEDDRVVTVSRSYHTMCNQMRKPSHFSLCQDKVQQVIDEIKNIVTQAVGEERYKEIYDRVCEEVDKLESPLYAVSGKDYLLKALREHLASKGASYSCDDGFKFRLARYCDLEPLEELGEAIVYSAKQGPYLQAS